jgi:hypothetical protein
VRTPLLQQKHRFLVLHFTPKATYIWTQNSHLGPNLDGSTTSVSHIKHMEVKNGPIQGHTGMELCSTASNDVLTQHLVNNDSFLSISPNPNNCLANAYGQTAWRRGACFRAHFSNDVAAFYWHSCLPLARGNSVWPEHHVQLFLDDRHAKNVVVETHPADEGTFSFSSRRSQIFVSSFSSVCAFSRTKIIS